VQQRQAVAALRGGQVKAAVELLEAGRTAKQALLLPSSPARATGLEALTEAYAAQGRMDDALACWEEAARIQVRSGRRRRPGEAMFGGLVHPLAGTSQCSPVHGSKRREGEQGHTNFQNL
jgi:tetratricopeptide (TPR) repeat protein